MTTPEASSSEPPLPEPRGPRGRSVTSERRQRVVDALCEAFAGDRIEMRELERRLDRASRARSESELLELLEDLDQGPGEEGGGGGLAGERAAEGSSLPVHASGRPPAEGRAFGREGASVPERQWTVALWSGRSRKGGWVPARKMSVVALQGGVELDFREATLAPGVTEVHVVAVMGAVEILVPPGVGLESSGFAILGSFEDEAGGTRPDASGPHRPGGGAHPAPAGVSFLRVSGFALMGAVQVEVRLPGETEREARLRKRRERRESGGG